MNILIVALQILGALFLAFTAGARAVEAIYQLRQNPELNTIQKVWQVIVNFFTIEKYKETK